MAKMRKARLALLGTGLAAAVLMFSSDTHVSAQTTPTVKTPSSGWPARSCGWTRAAGSGRFPPTRLARWSRPSQR